MTQLLDGSELGRALGGDAIARLQQPIAHVVHLRRQLRQFMMSLELQSLRQIASADATRLGHELLHGTGHEADAE